MGKSYFTATRINCGKGSHSALTTPYIWETIYSTLGNDSENGNNVKVWLNPHLLPKVSIGYVTMVSSSETERVWG